MNLGELINHYDAGERNFSGQRLESGEKIRLPFDLSGADFSNAVIVSFSVFSGINFTGSSFNDADLENVTFMDCDFTDCDFSFSSLVDTHFINCNLTGTVLDPEAEVPPLRLRHPFTIENARLIGYRTQHSRYNGDNVYQLGQTYTAPIFSVCTKTDCHPGLYVLPTLSDFYEQFDHVVTEYGLIKVSFYGIDVVEAGYKWRVKEFKVEEVITPCLT